MRIINRKEFLSLPEGTVFSEFEPHFFDGLFIKGETVGDDDYLEETLVGNVASTGSGNYSDIVSRAVENGQEFSLEFGATSRNGMYDDEQLYAVYSQDDVKQLVERLVDVVRYPRLKHVGL